MFLVVLKQYCPSPSPLFKESSRQFCWVFGRQIRPAGYQRNVKNISNIFNFSDTQEFNTLLIILTWRRYRASKKKLSFIVFRLRYVLLVKSNITRCVLETKYHAWAIWTQEEFLDHVFWPTVMTFEHPGGTQIGLLWLQNSSYSPPGQPIKDHWCRDVSKQYKTLNLVGSHQHHTF